MDAIRLPPSRRARAVPYVVLAAAVLLGTFSSMAGATVYKWSDGQGRIHYTDRPPPPDGKLLSIDTSVREHYASTTSAPRPAVSSPPASTTAQPIAGQPANPQVRKAVAADVATAQADQCKQAQDRYAMYVRSRHLFHEGPNKEQVFLSESELETERVNAKREAEEACAGLADR